MNILVLDNYDSFTYNLVHILRELEVPHEVHRNDALTVEEAQRYDGILLSPGPGIPSEAGIMPALLAACIRSKPVFGICLGHQAIGEALGGTLLNLDRVFHGVQTPVRHSGDSRLLEGIPTEFPAGRYHSWVIARDGFPQELRIIAEDEGGSIMAIEHRTLPVFGVQFHPESIMTSHGTEMMRNFIRTIPR